MILLNGVPVIFGLGMAHLTVFNLLVIMIEYYLLKKMNLQRLKWYKVVIANVLSVFLGFIIMLIISESLRGVFYQWESDLASKGAFFIGMITFIIATILIETPVYLIGTKIRPSWYGVLKIVGIANFITNIPVAIYYYIGLY